MKEIRSIQWVKDLVGTKTQAEWLDFAKEKFRLLREWSDNHGQKALTYGLLAGFFVAVFFKIFMLMLAISCILAFLVYEFAPEARQGGEQLPDQDLQKPDSEE